MPVVCSKHRLPVGQRIEPSPRGPIARISRLETTRRLNCPQAAPASLSYKDAGVDIDAGAELVRRIQKLNPSIGGFSGLVPFGKQVGLLLHSLRLLYSGILADSHRLQ